MSARLTSNHPAAICGSLVLLLGIVACGSEFSEADVRAKIAPSVVEVRDEFGGWGSGFLVEGNYVVTAAHVVWPSANATIVFDDGTEHTDIPVVSYDLLADIAFVGPIDTSAPHLEFADVESEREGNTAFNAGYSRDAEELIIKRGEFLAHESLGVDDVFQVSSTAQSWWGMSGGPATNGKGKVIGVLFGGRDFGSKSTSAHTVRDRLQKIAQGIKASNLDSRLPFDKEEGSNEHEFVLEGPWDTKTFIFRASAEPLVNIKVEAGDDVEYAIVNVFGGTLYGSLTDRPFRPARLRMHSIYGWDRPSFLVVRQRFDRKQTIQVKSTVPLAPHEDPDDGRNLNLGVTVSGVFDTPVDVDRYTISVHRNQRIGIQFRYPYGGTVTIDHAEAPSGGLTIHSEVGKDTLQFDYQAPDSGEFTIVVRPANLHTPTAYTLLASTSLSTDPKTLVKEHRPDGTLSSSVGEMLRFTFNHPIPSVQIDYPLNIVGSGEQVPGAALFEQGRRGETLALEQFNLGFYDEPLSIDQYVRRSLLANGLPLRGEKVTARREVETAAGAPAVIEDFEADDGKTKGVRLGYIHEGETGFMAIFYAPAEVFEEWIPVVDYCISTFSVGGIAVVQ